MADKRDLDAKKREQWQRLVTFGEHLKERRPGPQGIFAVRPELLVPLVGEWAA